MGTFRGLMLRKFIVLKRTTFIFILNFLAFSVPKNTHAVADFGNPGVLPVGRHQVTFRFGQASEIQDKFNNSGTLQGPSRMNKRMDNAFLMKQDRFRNFAKLLDEQLLPNRNLSREIDPGSVAFRGDASVDYFAPQVARGMTHNWSLGIAVPFVRYRSDIRAINVGVNKAQGVLKGVADPEKIGELNKDMGKEARMMSEGPKAIVAGEMERNNLRALGERDEQFVGDIVLGSSLRLYDTRYVDLYFLNQLTLPTGPKDDPDDMIDLNIFGKTQLQNILFANFDIYRWLELGVGVSYTWGISDDFEKRVPRSEDDFIPPTSTKETVRKDPGDAVGAQLYSNIKFSDYIHVGAGFEINRKQADRYSGSQGARYDLLEKDTDTESGIAKFKATYSAVDGYLKGEQMIPYSVTYAFADHVYGKNVERELTHELLLKFYF